MRGHRVRATDTVVAPRTPSPQRQRDAPGRGAGSQVAPAGPEHARQAQGRCHMDGRRRRPEHHRGGRHARNGCEATPAQPATSADQPPHRDAEKHEAQHEHGCGDAQIQPRIEAPGLSTPAPHAIFAAGVASFSLLDVITNDDRLASAGRSHVDIRLKGAGLASRRYPRGPNPAALRVARECDFSPILGWIIGAGCRI